MQLSKQKGQEVSPDLFMTSPGIEPGFTPWEGVVLTAWPWGRNRGDKIRTCDLCVPNAALYQTEPRLEATSIYYHWFREMSIENLKKFKKVKKVEKLRKKQEKPRALWYSSWAGKSAFYYAGGRILQRENAGSFRQRENDVQMLYGWNMEICRRSFLWAWMDREGTVIVISMQEPLPGAEWTQRRLPVLQQ